MPSPALAPTTTDTTAHEVVAPIGKALASPARLAILEVLAQSERSVDELVREVGGRLSTVSSHLQVLRGAHLVEVRREGTHLHYRLAGPDVAALVLQLQAVATRRLPAAAAAEEAGTDRPMERPDLLAAASGPGVVLLDVRPLPEYLAGHLPGARSAPLAAMEDQGAALPEPEPGRDLVVYGRSRGCALARAASRRLAEAGIGARVLLDGVPSWSLAGLPTVAGPEPGAHLLTDALPAAVAAPSPSPDTARPEPGGPPPEQTGPRWGHAPSPSPDTARPEPGGPPPEQTGPRWGHAPSPAGIRAARRIIR